MKTQKILVLIIGLICSFVLHGQFSDFDLSQYKLPDIRQNRLDATFNLLNDMSSSLSQERWDTTRSKHNNLAGFISFGYYYFRNTEKYQGKLIVNTFLNPTLNKYLSDNQDNKNTDTEINFVISSINRFYNERFLFFEISPSFSFYSDRSGFLHKNSSTAENTDRLSATRVSAPVSAGYGRIEPMEDLRLAIYILEELQKAGRISIIPSEDVIIDMAREISKIKRKRFFDTRQRKIEELHVIDSFLIANNIISQNDITYFAVLNDNWDYSSGPARETGFSVNTGIGNDIFIHRTKEKYTIDNTAVQDSKFYSNTYEVGGFINIKYAKPLNLYWQTGAGINTSYGMKFTRNPLEKEDVLLNYETNIFRTSINGMLQYLPDSRTSVGLDLTGNYQHSYNIRTLTDLDPDGFRMRSNILSIDASFDMYYYISPRFRVRLLTSLSGNNSDIRVRYESALPEDKNLKRSYYHNVSVTLTYSFF